MNSLLGPQIALEFGMSYESEVVVITGASAGVGRATVREFAANKIIPGYLDRYLAKNGYASQQTHEPADPGAPDNL